MVEVKKDQDQAAFREGIFVRALGWPLNSNPYSADSADGRLWAEGWGLIDSRRDNAARYVTHPPIKPAAEFIRRAPTSPTQRQAGTQKTASPRLFFLVYLAFAVAFGGFFLLMLLSIGRLTR